MNAPSRIDTSSREIFELSRFVRPLLGAATKRLVCVERVSTPAPCAESDDH